MPASLEIDTPSVLLPVPETGRLGAVPSPNFTGALAGFLYFGNGRILGCRGVGRLGSGRIAFLLRIHVQDEPAC